MPGKYKAYDKQRPIHRYRVSNRMNSIGIICQETEKAYLIKRFNGKDIESSDDYTDQQWYRKTIVKLNEQIGTGIILGDPFDSNHPWKITIYEEVKNKLNEKLDEVPFTVDLQEIQSLANTSTSTNSKNLKTGEKECPVCGNIEAEFHQKINKIFKCSVCSTYFQ